MTEAVEDRLAGAKAQGQAQFDSIREMVEELRRAESAMSVAFTTGIGRSLEDAADAVRQRIHEDALSVEVRSGWVAPGAWDAAMGRDRAKPEEYRILLCTGGPACQIVGEVSEHGEPETARLQVQDWFTPWTDFYPETGNPERPGGLAVEDAEVILLEYARCFYFGE